MTYAPMSSDQLRAKRYCCKSGCLHCPYGFTLKKYGLQFEKIDDLQDEDLLGQVSNPVLQDSKQGFYKVYLKEHLCAIIKVNHLLVLEIYHLPGFADQGLYKEMLESYFF